MAVDDVGAGYAGLTLLLRLRPDEIKIDRVVVSGVDASSLVDDYGLDAMVPLSVCS